MHMSGRLSSFPPIADSSSEVLILGSMPGAESLRKQQYYGHPRNHFWKLICAVSDEQFIENYEARTDMLLRNGVALWDVLGSCLREGSLDTNIKDEVPNDLSAFLDVHPGIDTICFNGQKAYQLFKRYFPDAAADCKCAVLPSSSPANTMPFEEKLRKWLSAFGG